MSDKIIGGIKEIHQFMGDEGNFLLPYAPAYLRLLQALDAPEYMDYNFVLCVSGAAVRVSWLQGWAAYKDEPNQSELFINGDRLAEYRKGFSGAGVEAEIYLNEAKKEWWNGNYSGSVTWVDGSKLKKDIVASIDKGIPVLAHGAAGEPTGLIIGYEDNGTRICIISIFTPDDKKNGESQYRLSGESWTDEITLYCIITGFKPRLVDKQLLREVMANIVYLARLKEAKKNIPGKNVSFGLDAVLSLSEHLIWDEGFESLETYKKYEGDLSWHYDRPKEFWREDGARSLADRFWAGYCDFLCMLNGFESLKLFIDRYKEITPEWSVDLEEAGRCAHRIADYTGELWNYVTADEEGLKKFKTADVRSIFAAHMLRVKIYYTRITEIFERLLNE